MDQDFILETEIAKVLYHDHAKDQPIIDYHCHLPPDEIANDRKFEDLGEAWLEGDHYKWRAMRTCGINEKLITGDTSYKEKFMKWAEVVPQTMRNPLYHWTHLELQRYFGIDTLLNPDTALDIYKEASAKLQTSEYSVRSLIRKMNVEVIVTTDDPVDDLRYHKQILDSDYPVIVLPAFRPDKAMAFDSPGFSEYVRKLEEASGTSIIDLDSYLEAIKERHDYFHSKGCRLSDHGINHIFANDFTASEIESAFKTLINRGDISGDEVNKLKSYMLLEFAKMDHKRGWVQQYHLGALRDTNSRLLTQLGPDTGFDSMGDFLQAESLSKFLDTLDATDQLTKTIIYNVNPMFNEVFATMIGNYNDGSVRGKVQWGSAWWFMDQLDGMERQLNTLSTIGVLSTFVGMLTDSRSFLSFPRHEYFRRLLCNLIGNDVEKGLLPNDIAWLGKMVENISYNNARAYFDFWE